MREIFPGVLHWTAKHPDIGMPVSSYFVVPAGVVLDPLTPEEGLDAVAEHGRPSQVVLTTGLHTRHADRFAEAFGCDIRVSREGAERIGGALDVVTYGDGEEIAPGVRAIRVGALAPDEYALHITATEGALALADALHRYGGTLDMFEDELLGDDPASVRRGLVDRFRSLLELDVEHLLLAHGDPVVGDGGSALREVVDRFQE